MCRFIHILERKSFTDKRGIGTIDYFSFCWNVFIKTFFFFVNVHFLTKIFSTKCLHSYDIDVQLQYIQINNHSSLWWRVFPSLCLADMLVSTYLFACAYLFGVGIHWSTRGCQSLCVWTLVTSRNSPEMKSFRSLWNNLVEEYTNNMRSMTSSESRGADREVTALYGLGDNNMLKVDSESDQTIKALLIPRIDTVDGSGAQIKCTSLAVRCVHVQTKVWNPSNDPKHVGVEDRKSTRLNSSHL